MRESATTGANTYSFPHDLGPKNIPKINKKNSRSINPNFRPPAVCSKHTLDNVNDDEAAQRRRNVAAGGLDRNRATHAAAIMSSW
jgi:hypothetical protein